MNVRDGNWFGQAVMLPAAVWAAAALVVALGAACSGGSSSDDQEAYGNVMSFDTTGVRLTTDRDTVSLRIELAMSPEQRQMGLMERRQLAENAGMLFVYDSMQPADAGFWMYRTRIPLDIAFLDSVGTIRSIRSMVPCPTDISEGCKTYAPDARYQYALEVNAGFFARHGVRVGHTLALTDLADRARPGAR